MANRSFANSRMYTGHVMPVLLDCSFVVDSTNGNGLGIRSLKGPYVQNVFMHTTATPGLGNANPMFPGIFPTNPNPAVGNIIITMQDNYSKAYIGGFSIISPLGALVVITGGLVIGAVYVIAIVGDATLADWAAVGLPAGIPPAVGASFVASSAGAGASVITRVALTAAAGSGIAQMEVVGDSNTAIAPLPASTFGARFIIQTRSYANALAAPVDGTVIALSFLLGNSSVLVGGE